MCRAMTNTHTHAKPNLLAKMYTPGEGYGASRSLFYSIMASLCDHFGELLEWMSITREPNWGRMVSNSIEEKRQSKGAMDGECANRPRARGSVCPSHCVMWNGKRKSRVKLCLCPGCHHPSPLWWSPRTAFWFSSPLPCFVSNQPALYQTNAPQTPVSSWHCLGQIVTT